MWMLRIRLVEKMEVQKVKRNNVEEEVVLTSDDDAVDGKEYGISVDKEVPMKDKMKFSYENVCKGDVIKYRIPESNIYETSRIMSRAGKYAGPNQF